MKLKVNGRTILCDVSRIGEAQAGDIYVREGRTPAKYIGGGFAEFKDVRPTWEVLSRRGDVLKVRRIGTVKRPKIVTLILTDEPISGELRATTIGKSQNVRRDKEIFLFRIKAGA